MGGFYYYLRPALGHHASKGNYNLFSNKGLFLQQGNIGFFEAKPEYFNRNAE